MKTKNKAFLLFSFLVIFQTLQLALGGNVYASNSPFGVDADFVRNNTTISTSDVASNVFRLKNNTQKPIRIHLNFSVPSGWSVLGQTDKEYEIKENDSTFIPVRVVPDKFVKGGTSYVITVTLLSNNDFQFAALNWYVSIPAKTNWTARIPIKQQFFINDQDSSGFQVLLANNGNSDEEIRLTLVPDRRIEVLRKSDGGASLLAFTIPLPAGTDTLLTFPIMRKPSTRANKSSDADIKAKPSKETYSIQVIAKATTSEGSWNGTMQFTKAGNISQFSEFARTAVPLTLEANVYDVLSNSTTMSLDAYGNTTLSGHRLLSYRFQTVFINNYFNENSFLGNNHYLGYFDDHTTIELGEVNGWGRSLLTGRGIKASYNYSIHTLGAMYTRSPGFFRDYHSEGYGLYYNMKMHNLNFTSNYSHNASTTNHLSSDVVNGFGSTKINRVHQILAGGGYSIDRVLNQQATGYGFDLNYSGSYKNIFFSAGTTYGSSSYVLARGVTMFSTRTSYSLNAKNNFAITTQNFTQRPSYFVNGVITAGNYSKSDRYELRWSMNNPAYTLSLIPSYRYDENQMIRVAMRLLGAEYNVKNFSHVRFSAMGSMGYAHAFGYSVPDFFVARTSTYARWDKFYLSLRYTYGPTQLAEQLRFVHDRINPQSVYLIGTYDYWMSNDKLLLTTTSNVLYETYFQKVTFRLRPELFYYAKNGIRLSCYASFFSSSQGANPIYDESSGRRPFEKISDDDLTIGFGIRKQFGVPIPGKKFVSLHTIIFKDLNGNHKQDPNEEGVENILVNVRASELFSVADDSATVKKETGEDFISNRKGEIIYENIPAGLYKIKCASLTPNNEWFDAGEQEFKVDSKQSIYIPLTRGVRIKGSVLIEKDKYSTNESVLDLSRIRVTALDSSGKSFSVLTDQKGEFVMNLPSGVYVLTINESAFGNNYVFIQNKINLDLTKNYENFSITFNAVERKRKMEIQKFDNNKIKDKQ